MTEIIQGLVVGVGAAVVLSLFSTIQKWISRRQQIAFIRKRLISGFTKLADCQNPLSLIEERKETPAVRFRVIFLKSFLRELQAIADHRLDR